ncbi:hypothetical protein [Legionella sp. km772]|uniref:hypothetical protein n=1 Tax=Legionella sp. km772 TaxID=2498111 RepID=UPI000F8ED864|nr:hypothetical protein [Legionella sp. km772]RUR06756.1 hypothetical protein ELY15_12905 [Legionella sp. km772]
MQTFYQIMGIIAAGLILFLLYQTIKGRPDYFTRDNMNKSFLTMGVLALGLIGFVTLLIFLVRQT